jgi:hypothetical protein
LFDSKCTILQIRSLKREKVVLEKAEDENMEKIDKRKMTE